MNLRRRVRWLGESLLVCIALSTIPFLTRRAAVRLANGLGNLGFRCSARLRKMSLANLAVALPELPASEREQVARQSFRTFALTIVDMFWFGRFTDSRIRQLVSFDASFDLYWQAKPGVIVTGHFGNWEVLGLAIALHGDPCMSVAMPLNNTFADLVLNRFRRLTGQSVVERRGAVRRIIKVLRDGGKTAMLLDQNTLPDEGGAFVDFFGLPVPVSKAAATVAARAGATIVFVFCCADASGAYTAHARSTDGGEGDDETRVTQMLTNTLEREVRQRPGQWLWMYKRWKYIPGNAPAERYPYYAQSFTHEEEKSGEEK